MDEMSATDRARLIEWLRNLPFFLPAHPRRVGGVTQVSSKNNPTTTMSNQITATASFKIFFILILQTDCVIF